MDEFATILKSQGDILNDIKQKIKELENGYKAIKKINQNEKKEKKVKKEPKVKKPKITSGEVEQPVQDP